MHTFHKNKELRKSDQYLLPVYKSPSPIGKYDIYPSFKIGENRISEGFESLAETIARYRVVFIDGYNGVFFNTFRIKLEEILCRKGFKTCWTETSGFLKAERWIREMTTPFLGGDDPLFGKKCILELEDFFMTEKLETFSPDKSSDITFLIGPGAFFAACQGLRIYIDIPKNELQFRSRAGSVTNLGYSEPSDPKSMYKCFYFVDWVVLNRHKRRIFSSIDIFIDGQRPETPVWIEGDILRDSLHQMSRGPFRARPWFEPGAWGGTWIKNNIGGINKEVPNYAWSFELITPENGLLIESSSILLEISFDCIMYQEAEAILGDSFVKYGTDFPIRFDLLDTFDGGNLSIQCHPRPEYMKENFGEYFTQEESYYILDTKDGAEVYLGFCDDIDPLNFRKELEESNYHNKPFDTDRYINKQRIKKHDLLLIPYGTIHGSGKNNLVLEISTTPYIFTFKMYDWLRPDLDGKPRPLNIGRGMENLFFDRKGVYVADNLISKPELLEEGSDWRLFRLPTHETHSYEVRRYHFRNAIFIPGINKALIMSLTNGKYIYIETENGFRTLFSFAETFIVPAAAGKIRIENCLTDDEAVLVMAFMK